MTILESINKIASLVEEDASRSKLLAPPATSTEIEELVNCLSFDLPPQLLVLLNIANGETPYIDPEIPSEFVQNTLQVSLEEPNLFLDYPFFKTTTSLREYLLDRSIEQDLGTGNGVSVYPKDTVRPYERFSKWIPIAGIQGDYFSIDLDPGVIGNKGQVILHGANVFMNIKIADDLESFLELILAHYLKGEYLSSDHSFENDTLAKVNA